MTAVQETGTLAQLFAPPAVTLVGATPRSHVTEVLLANFTRADQPFPGPINLINPGRSEVLGRPAVPDIEAVDGPLGLVYVLLDPTRTLDFLDAVRRIGAAERVCGFVVYGAGFAEAGEVSAQNRLTEIAADLGVPVLGPQSTGLVSASAGLLGITDPVPEQFVPGRVGVVAQSTGLLGGALSWLFRRGVGVEKAVGFGNGAALDGTELAATLCADPDIDVVCVYVDAITSIDQIVALGEASWRTGTPVVLYPGGSSAAAQAAARSHTGVLATNERAIRGCAEQCGVVLVDQFEGLLWATELLGRKDVQALGSSAGVGIFTASGGGGIIAVEAIERAGVRLAIPSAVTRSGLGLAPTSSANPFDIGAISLDRPEDYRDKVRTYAADDDIAIVVKPESLGAPSQRLASHRRSLESFVDGVTDAGKIAVITYPYPEDPREYADTVHWDEVVVAGGTAELGGKLALLQSYAARPRRDSWPTWYRRELAVAPEDAMSLWPADATDALLGALGVSVPRSCVVSAPTEIDVALAALAPTERFVAKTAAALSHRAKAGGVLLGLRSRDEVAAAVALLGARFDAPVVLCEEVAHTASFFAGLQVRPDGRVLLAFGAGVATDDSDVALRLCPLEPADARRLVADAGIEVAAEQVADVLVQVSRAPEQVPTLAVLDINPFGIVADHRLVALDAKAYGPFEER